MYFIGERKGMNNKLLMAFRMIFGVAILIIIAGLLTTTSVQSADLPVYTVFMNKVNDYRGTSDLESSPLSVNATSLLLAKDLTKDNGGTAVESDWTLFIEEGEAGQLSVPGSATPVQVTDVSGTYDLSESSIAGYTQTSLTCDNAVGQVTSVTVGLDETVTCTFVNNDDAPSLLLKKQVTKDNGGTAVESDWTLFIEEGEAGELSVTGSLTPVEVTNQAGTYNLSESSVAGYTQTSLTCDNSTGQVTSVTVGLGETVICTFVNEDDVPSLLLAKNVTKDNGGTAVESDWTLFIEEGEAGELSVTGSLTPVEVTNQAGTYNLSESSVVGYTQTSLTCDNAVGQVTSVTVGLGETVTCTFVNDDVGFNITPLSGLLTSESGLTDTFDVVLDTEPVANVTLALNSSDLTEGTIDKPSLTFTTLNWNDPQTVTITGVEDDSVADGDQPYTIVTGPVTSSDTDYASLNPGTIIPDVSVTNSDNDTPGYTVTPNTDLWVSEGGKTETIQVLLKSKPTSQVQLSVQSSDTQEEEGIVSIENATVNPAVWPQTTPTKITITGVDDCTSGGGSLTLTVNAASSDPNYNGTVAVLPVTNFDAPTIGWVEPVGTDEIYISDGISDIYLEVVSLCPEPIEKIKFTRWIAAEEKHAIIGEDFFPPPYYELLKADKLELPWTQVFAQAFGLPSEIHQTFSKSVRILILNEFGSLAFLPLINR
jgi:phosphoribosylanthranilate isomerase